MREAQFELTTKLASQRPDPGMRERVARMLFDRRSPRKRTKSGRYQILGELGRGGMGVVYQAHDPKLRRVVALKALRLDRLDAIAQARMIREARAMARLSHPNVVGVHDVELDGPEGVVVVMEYVDGQTLRDWLQAHERTWSTILPKFLAAGRGLAAAHAAGLLHRDFKPSNVLIGTDDRARVADFGLARTPVGDITLSRTGRQLMATLDSPLTTCGTVLGTPDFMAPEQLQGNDASALSDQYAFCVSLWWAIAGEPPFPAGPGHALVKLEGAPAWSGPRVPRRLVRALRRGLSPRPHDRWPSMEALLDALSPSERSRLGVGVQALSIVGLGLALLAIAPPEPPPRCDGAAQLRPAWNQARRHAIQRAMLDAERPYAERAWVRTEARLEHYAADWTAMYEQSCQTALGVTSVNLEPVPAMRCLQRSRLEFEATVERLAEPGSIEQLDALLDDLPALERCRGTTELPPHLLPFASEADAIEDVRRTLATARSLGELLTDQGRLDEAQAQLDTALRILTAVHGEDSLEVAFTHESLGRLARQRGDDPGALTELQKATTILDHRLAPEHPRRLGVRAHMIELLHAVGRSAEAEAELRATLDAAGDSLAPEHWVSLRLHTQRGLLALERGDAAEARRQLEQQWALYSEGRSKQAQVRAHTALVLARALWTDPSQRHRARAIAAETIADDVAMGHAGPRLRQDLRTWLAEHEWSAPVAQTVTRTLE